MTTAALAPLRVLSLGWGVQSTALAIAAAEGDLELFMGYTPRDSLEACATETNVDFAVHADTTWERAATYRYASLMTPWLEARGLRIFTRQPGSDSQPAFQQADGTYGCMIPAYMNGPKGKGQVTRQCTNHWKIRVTRRIISLALKSQKRTKKPGSVEMLLGISLDEYERAKDSDVAYIKNRFPLLDLGVDREACKAYIASKGLPIPPKSSCVFCPYHNAAAWQDIRQTPEDWAVATRIDSQIRDARPPYPLYVHPARIPLADAVTLPIIEQESMCDGGYCFL